MNIMLSPAPLRREQRGDLTFSQRPHAPRPSTLVKTRAAWIEQTPEPPEAITVDWRLELLGAVIFMVGCGAFAWLAPLLPAIGRMVAP